MKKNYRYDRIKTNKRVIAHLKKVLTILFMILFTYSCNYTKDNEKNKD